MKDGHKGKEPDARSVADRVLVAATALLLSTLLLFVVALFVVVLGGGQVR